MGTVTSNQLENMIQQSQFGNTENSSEFWFSHEKQKKMAYSLAYDLVVDGVEVNEAIKTAKLFVDTFYNEVVKRGSWEK